MAEKSSHHKLIVQKRSSDLWTFPACTHSYTRNSCSIKSITNGWQFWLLRKNAGRAGLTQLVFEFVNVSIQPQLWRHRRLVQMVALIAALAGLDEHHGSTEKVPIRAGEGHIGCARATGGAATAIPAHPAVVGPVQASAPAAGVRQAVRLGGLVRTRALPSFLWN